MKNRRKGFTVVELLIVLCVITILAAVLIPYFSDLIGRAEDAAAAYNARIERYEQMLAEPTATTWASEPKPTIIETAAPETTTAPAPTTVAPAPTEPPLPEPYEQVKRWNAILSASGRMNPTMHDALTELADGEENIPAIVRALFAAEAAAPQTCIVWDQESDRFTVVTEKTSETVRFHSAPDEPPTELPAAFAYRLWRVYNESHEIPYSKSSVSGSTPRTSDVYSAYWAGSETPTCLTEKSNTRVALEFTVGFDMGLWDPTSPTMILMAADYDRFEEKNAILPIRYRTNGGTKCRYYGASEVAHYGSAGELHLTGWVIGQTNFAYHEYGAIGSLSYDDPKAVRHYILYLEEGCTLSDPPLSTIKTLYKKKPENFVDNRIPADDP